MQYNSAGVYVNEKDLSTQAASVTSSSAAIVGAPTKGSLDIKLISNVQDFLAEYGQPVPGNWFHYGALPYLRVGTQLYCKRVTNGALYGGVSIGKTGGANFAFVAGSSVKTFFADSHYPNALFYVFGKDPGVWNNKLKVSVVLTDPTDYAFQINVFQTDDNGNDIQMESWDVSRKNQVDGFGNQMYLEDKINGFSKYIVVADNTALANTELPIVATKLALASGSDGNAVNDTIINQGWETFSNKDEVDVRMLINAGKSTVTVHNELIALAEARRDCEALLDMPSASMGSVQDMVTYRETTLAADSSFAELFAPMILIQDTYSGKLLAVPPSGYAAGIIAYSNYVGNPWSAAAGFNRANLNIFPEVVGICDGNRNRMIFDQGKRDTLDQAEINYFQSFTGRGRVLWNEDTLQVKNSALQSAHVRRLLIYLEISLAPTLMDFVYEPNDAKTRFLIVTLFEQFLQVASAKGAFQLTADDPRGYIVICDERNNTPATIDRQEIHVALGLKPIRVGKYIPFDVIITGTGVSFSELISQGLLF
jgi:phage tail sheath protein FI